LQAADIELSAALPDVSELLVALDDFHSKEKYLERIEGSSNLGWEIWTDRPRTVAVAVLKSCSKLKMPNIHRMLVILATLPVSTCEPVRVFSKLRPTLTATRSTMSEDRLEAMLLLQCHRKDVHLMC